MRPGVDVNDDEFFGSMPKDEPANEAADPHDYIAKDIGVVVLPPEPNGSPYSKYKEAQRSPPTTPADIVARWRNEGPLVRIPTGIAALDDLCRGGLPVPWRVMIVGAPSAGKTATEIIIADKLARAAEEHGLCVGCLCVDEEPEDITVRLAQIAGFTLAQAETRDPQVVDDMQKKLSQLRIRMYDSTWTIEAAGVDLSAWAVADSRRAALFIDSIQAARAERGDAKSPRELVEANVVAMRLVSTEHRLLVVATSEANRDSYRDEDAAERKNDLAAGAESRAIEFGAQTQLMLRTPKGHPDIIHFRVAKNRRAQRGEFWQRLDWERHTLASSPDPKNDIASTDADQASNHMGKVEKNARKILPVIVANPGLGVGQLDVKAQACKVKIGAVPLRVALEHLENTGRIRDDREQHGARVDHHYYAISTADPALK